MFLDRNFVPPNFSFFREVGIFDLPKKEKLGGMHGWAEILRAIPVEPGIFPAVPVQKNSGSVFVRIQPRIFRAGPVEKLRFFRFNRKICGGYADFTTLA
mgnify:CR=1 FL=1